MKNFHCLFTGQIHFHAKQTLFSTDFGSQSMFFFDFYDNEFS